MTFAEPGVVPNGTTANDVSMDRGRQSGHPETLPPATVRDRVWLAVLLIATAVLYLWNITINGYGNTFYAGAAWAGSRNWEALLFGSVDPSNFITVDKPPVSQWVMGLSGQIFGFSSASMLIPEALMGVAAVALMYAMVARVAGRSAGLIAGLALAITPVAAMMFRFNNPDAAMVLLMTAAAYCTVRATARGSARWLALAGVALGFAFLAKMLEGLMVLPALGVVYLVAAPPSFWRRMWHLVIAAVALVLSAGWYVVLTLLWPASSRPYLAGSTDNNFMNLVLGYNGLERIEGGASHGGSHHTAVTHGIVNAAVHENHGNARQFVGAGRGGGPGITRLFTGEFGAEISFMLPTALIALIVVLALRGRRPRTDLVRAAAILFGLWLLVDGVVLSFMNGGSHPYYSLAIAPPIAGLVGLGIQQTWSARDTSVTWRRHTARFGLAAMVVAAGIWSFVLLDRVPGWHPWLRWCVLGAAVIAAVIALVPTRLGRSVVTVVGILAAIGVFAAPAAYAITGDAAAHTGGGPSVIPRTHTGDIYTSSTTHSRDRSDSPTTGGDRTTTVPARLDTVLQRSHARWAAAVPRTSTASVIELAARVPVMGVGGFSHDPAPTLSQFEKYVADKDIGYYLVPESTSAYGQVADEASSTHGHRTRGADTDGSVTAEIQQWVQAHFRGTVIGDYTVYDLTATPSPQRPHSTTTTHRNHDGSRRSTTGGGSHRSDRPRGTLTT